MPESRNQLKKEAQPQEEFDVNKANGTESVVEVTESNIHTPKLNKLDGVFLSKFLLATIYKTSTTTKMELLKQSEFFQDNPKLFEECTEDKFEKYWKDAKAHTFLEGWKMRRFEIKNASGEIVPKIHFLSPLNIILKSLLSVIEYLRVSGASEQEAIKLSKKLRIKEEKFSEYVSKYFKCILLKFVGQDSNKIHIRVKPTIQMGKMKKLYSERVGIPVTSLRFLFKGRRINDDKTPKVLGMKPDDVIEVQRVSPLMMTPLEQMPTTEQLLNDDPHPDNQTKEQLL